MTDQVEQHYGFLLSIGTLLLAKELTRLEQIEELETTLQALKDCLDWMKKA